MTTATKKTTLRDALNSGNPALTSSAMEAMRFGDMNTKVTATFANLTSGTAQDITNAEHALDANLTLSGPFTLGDGERLPPVGSVLSLTAGGTPVAIVPADATLAAGQAKISADGKTITFQAAVTAYSIEYLPGPAVPMDSPFPLGAP